MLYVKPIDFSLLSTALHELGHVVGLEHTNVEAALMFAFGDSCDFTKDDFLADDLAQFDFTYACEGADCQLPNPPNPRRKSARTESTTMETVISTVTIQTAPQGGFAEYGEQGNNWVLFDY